MAIDAAESDRAQRAVDRIHQRRPRALGVILDMRTDTGARLRTGDDPRGARVDSVAVALPSGDGEPAPVVLFTGPDALRWLGPLSIGDEAPYLVFDDAHRALTVITLAGLPTPTRFGCATIATTLLAEGADRRRDHRPLADAVRDSLRRELPEPLPLAPASMRVRLGCEAQAVLALLEALTPELRTRNLARVFQFEAELLPAVVAMERAGIGVDAPGLERVARGWVRERGALESSDGSDPSARIARLDKLISTYRWWARDFVDADRRIRCRLHPLAADSGRFSCTDPNLQQVPGEHTAPGMRACFVAPPGHKLIVADYAQIELRVAAQLAPCDALRAVFRAGRDPHRATAATLAGKPEQDIDSHERKLAKAVNFGFLFGMGAKRFRQYARDSYGLELDDQQAAAARQAFFRTFPGIAAWHQRTRGLSRRSDHEAITVTTAMGRRRTFPAGRFSFNAALNIPVQGTAAEGFKLAMLRLHDALAEIGGRGVLVVHDEYIAEVPEGRAEAGRALVESVMVAAMRELLTEVPVVVEAEIADHWS